MLPRKATVKSSLDAQASDLDASFDILLVVVAMRLAGPFSLLEPTAFPSGAVAFSITYHILWYPANLRVPVACVGREMAQQPWQALTRGV